MGPRIEVSSNSIPTAIAMSDAASIALRRWPNPAVIAMARLAAGVTTPWKRLYDSGLEPGHIGTAASGREHCVPTVRPMGSSHSALSCPGRRWVLRYIGAFGPGAMRAGIGG